MAAPLARLLPQVSRHLAIGKTPAGAVACAPGVTLPVVLESIEAGDFVSRRRYYVGYADGRPAVYFSPAYFDTLVEHGTAWYLMPEGDAAGNTDGGPSTVYRLAA